MGKSQFTARRSSDQMFPLVERYESSNQSPKEFCEQHGLSVGTFHYWKTKYREQRSAESTRSFQRIKVLADQPGKGLHDRHIEISTSSGVTIKIPLD